MLRTLFICLIMATPSLVQGCGIKTADLMPKSLFLEQPSSVQNSQFSADRPAKILVIGDSLAVGVGIFLKRRVKALGLHAQVSSHGKTSTGLARRDFYDWPSMFAAFMQNERPDIVIAHFGANDMQTINRPTGRVAFGSDGWEEAYREEIRNILHIAAQGGAAVYWLGPGPDRNSKLNRHLAYVSQLYQQEAQAAGAGFMAISDFTATAEGGYLQSIPIEGRSVTIRSGDGSHFTGTGYTMIANRFLGYLAQNIPSIFQNRDTVTTDLQ